jgi:hypothetical protein
MRTIFNLSFFLILLSVFSCKKNPNEKKVEITGDNLTGCPTDMTCTYLYQDGVDFGEPSFLNLKKGNFKIFKYSAVLGKGFYAKHVYIRVPLNAAQFELNNAQVVEGAVRYANPCATCDLVGLKVTGGHFKGVKTAGSSQSRGWLLEGKVYLGTLVPSAYQDSIYIKQYFALDPVGL